MLPFLNKHKVPGVIVSTRKPDADKPKDDEQDQGLKACAEDILRAIADNDSQHLALALRAAFQICDSEPHEEGPHTEDNSYDSQNIKAAKQD